MYNFLYFLFRIIKGLANRLVDKNRIQPREFTNAVLKKYAHIFNGSVINVSGWNDSDWEGGFYQGYFANCSKYVVSNARGYYRGLGSMADTRVEEIEIDLEKELEKDLVGKYDVVFNHTTLEHVFDLDQAFKNLCNLSNDVLIIVVPVMQNIHITRTYGDYWRITTLALARLLKENNFELLVLDSNDQPFAPIYSIAIATRNPQRYEGLIEKKLNFEMGAAQYGSSLKKDAIEILLKEKQ